MVEKSQEMTYPFETEYRRIVLVTDKISETVLAESPE